MNKKRIKKTPETFADALAAGYAICEEPFTGHDLNRQGHFEMQRIDRGTGDVESIIVPYIGKFTVGKPKGYRLDRARYEPRT